MTRAAQCTPRLSARPPLPCNPVHAKAEHKAKLAQKFADEKAKEQEIIAKELAVIEARRKIENAAKERAKEEAVKESQASLAVR